MFLLFRSDNELISGRARTSATRLSALPGDADAVLPVSLVSSDPAAGLSDWLGRFTSRPDCRDEIGHSRRFHNLLLDGPGRPKREQRQR